MTESGTARPAPASGLDAAALGELLRRLPVIARRAGHDSPQAILGYVAATTPEAEFVRDIFTLTARGMAERWYGGEENIQRFGRTLAEQAEAAIPRGNHGSRQQ